VEQLDFVSDDSVCEDLEKTILIDVSTLPKLNLALQQNAIPLIQDLGIKNNTQEPLERVELVLQSDPPVCQQQIWKMERIGAEVCTAPRLASVREASLAAELFCLEGHWRPVAEGRVQAVLVVSINAAVQIGHVRQRCACFFCLR